MIDATSETFSSEFIRCYECGHTFYGLWPEDMISPSRPCCERCESMEVFPTADAQPWEEAQSN